MKYVVDEVIEDTVVLENLETGEILNVMKGQLKGTIYDGAIFLKKEDYYVTDLEEEKKRRGLIQQKLERLKRKDF